MEKKDLDHDYWAIEILYYLIDFIKKYQGGKKYYLW